MRRIATTLLFLLGLFITAQAQVITTDPEFPTSVDLVTITFDATQGTGGLEGYTGDVYAHTGVITDQSTDGSDWKYVVAVWGENTPKAKMERDADNPNLYTLDITPSIREYYGVPEGETIEQMAFVFRSSDGSLEGKAEGGSDIFAEVYANEFNVKLTQPADPPTFHSQNSTVSIEGIASTNTGSEQLTLFIEGQQVQQVSNNTIRYDYNAQTAGSYEIRLEGTNGTNNDSTAQQLVVNPTINEQARPQNLQDGITYVDDNTVRLSLFAPNKEFVYVLGDFNNWQPQPEYFMNRETVNEDSTYYWLEINGLSAGQEYSFQYLVDGEIRVADPYSEKVLQPDDQYISGETYPNLKPYPGEETDVSVGVLQPGKQNYNWQHTNYDLPDQDNLLIYELLIRDFTADHDFKTLTDTLDYLDSLGVNAIELMPVMEFEGNISWGYNSAFMFATDKYYGPSEDLKRFIDEAHSRDMAVILDIVLNHAYGQSPLVRLWNEGTYGRSTTENPYLNVESPNQTFSFGYDFNHEAAATKYYVDRVTRYWLQEYRADGYRYDFTKGFTQNSGDGWAYDADRIRLLKRMADQQWAVNDSSYVILEHLTANQEEMELSNYKMLLWGNYNYSYNQSTMGYAQDSDFSGISYTNRGWNDPHVVGYMESHDEERITYKNLQFGNSNSSGSYDITDLETALNRNKMAAAFFFTIPGPKMIWQFGELGYDISIDENGRTGEKPIKWEYYDDESRKKLYDTYKELIRLRNSHAAFTSTESQIQMNVGDLSKTIQISHPDLEVTIAGNFNVTASDIKPSFTQAGDWYDFFSGDTLSVSNTDTTLTMGPGEFHIYTTQKFEAPDKELIRFLPTQMDVQISQSFSGSSSPQDYRLVALPGRANESLANVMSGDPNITWQAYWDNGQTDNFMVKYDGSNTFTLEPGNGFWVTSKENFAYNQTVPTVDINANNHASIPLHEGWNIISNPLHTDVAWSQVSAANNGNLQPIWHFDGSYSQATNFASARSGEAFYFLNDQDLDHLLIPYEESSANKKTDTKQNEIKLVTRVDGKQTSSNTLTFVPSKQSTPPSVVAPPSGFEGASLRFASNKENQESKRVSCFAQIYRTPNPEGHRIKLNLSAKPGEPVSISAKGWDETSLDQIALLDTESGQKYSLMNGKEAKITPEKEKTNLLLVIGDTSYINKQQEEFLPNKIDIKPNYPNPFNPSTTLRFELPEQTEVRLQVFNVLGQRVSTLINNEVREAGLHTVTFDASRQASGMYFAVFEIGDRRFVQKMMLIK